MQIKLYSRIILFIALISGFSLPGYGQVGVVKSDNKVIIEGRVFYLHVVKPGQTLYSIGKAYSVSESEIIRENPGADKGLQVSQLLKIPVPVPGAEPAIAPPPQGTGYIQYVVKQGETMYSISKKYNIRIEDLEKANPQVINNAIATGQVILIPSSEPEVREPHFTYHKVRRRETVFGIAHMYNITEDQLKQLNPELLEKFPRPGQMLKIPVLKEKAAVIEVPEIRIEDSPSLVGSRVYDTASIASNYSYYLDSLPKISGRVFNVAYLIPFNYRPLPEAVPEDESVDNPEETINLDNVSNPNDQMLSSRNFLEFMEGSLLAIDSLRKQGIDVNIFIFDTQKSPTRVRQILNSREFQKMDLIIGPFYSYNVEIVSAFSSENRIPMVSPFSTEAWPLQSNPYLFQLNPGYKAEYDHIADYLAGFSDKNIVFIHGTDSMELEKYNFLRNDLLMRLSQESIPDTLPFREITYNLSSPLNFSQELTDNLSLEKENIVVIPEINEAFVSTVITQLYFQLKNYSISVVGMPHWYAFQNTDFIYFHKLSLSYFTPYYFSYDSANVRKFLKEYRKIYYAEPVTLTKKGGLYAFLGYDLSYYFLKVIDTYGKKFILHLYDEGGHELMTDFKFFPEGRYGGFENQSLMLVRFYDNLDIIAEPYQLKQKITDIKLPEIITEPSDTLIREAAPDLNLQPEY